MRVGKAARDRSGELIATRDEPNARGGVRGFAGCAGRFDCGFDRWRGRYSGTPWAGSSPATQTLEVLHLDGAHYRIVDVFQGNNAVRAMPFDRVELELGVLWAR
jgi:hypothetical protein